MRNVNQIFYTFYHYDYSFISKLLAILKQSRYFQNSRLKVDSRLKQKPNQLAYFIQLSLALFIIYAIKIAKLYVISKLIWDSISIGNPPQNAIFCMSFFFSFHILDIEVRFCGSPTSFDSQVQVDQKSVPEMSRNTGKEK